MLKFIAPNRLLSFSIIIWLMFYISIPTTYINTSPSFFPLLLLFSYILSFLFGMLIVKGKKEIVKREINSRDKMITYISIVLGTVGVLLKFYQRFIQQGYLFADNYTQLRIELMKGELNSGALGLVTAILAPFGILSFLMILYYRKEHKPLLFIHSILLIAYPIFESFFTQGRIIIVIVVSMIVIVSIFHAENFTNLFHDKISLKLYRYRILAFPKRLVSKKIVIITLIAGTIFVLFSVSIVKSRLDYFGYRNVIAVWERQQEMRLDKDFKKRIMKSEDLNLEAAKFNLKHYFAHGVFEYIRLVNHVDKPYGTYYGEYIFNPYFKVLRFLGIKQRSFDTLNNIVHKKNVYTTFWGPFYLDFGVFGVLIALIFGALLKYIYIKARKGFLPFILLYAYFSFIILGSMFLNLMLGSSIYIFNSILIIFVLYSILPKHIVVKTK